MKNIGCQKEHCAQGREIQCVLVFQLFLVPYNFYQKMTLPLTTKEKKKRNKEESYSYLDENFFIPVRSFIFSIKLLLLSCTCRSILQNLQSFMRNEHIHHIHHLSCQQSDGESFFQSYPTAYWSKHVF